MWSKYPSIESLPLNSVVASTILRRQAGENTLIVKGYATHQINAPIAAVEVSVDDGLTWQPARVTYQEGKYSWTLWEAEVAGCEEHGTVHSRAVDVNGNKQQPDCKWNLRGVAFNPWGMRKW